MLIAEKELRVSAQNNDPEISIADYQAFAQSKGHHFNLSHSLQSSTASARIFSQWQLDETLARSVREFVSNFPLITISPIAASTVNLNTLNTQVNIPLNVIPTVSFSFNLHANTARFLQQPRYSRNNNRQEDDNDNNYDNLPHCAPAA
jgi:hypothetical protein